MKIFVGLFLVFSTLLYCPVHAMSHNDEGEEREKLIHTSASQRLVRDSDEKRSNTEDTCFKRMVRRSQNFCYQVMARTCWDSIMQGFKPGRIIALEALDIQSDDKVLFVGEGTGLDFEVLPERFNKNNLKAFDFSPEMVKKSKLKAAKFGIPEKNCFVADAQHLPFIDEKFDKIYFPLSLGSIPDPTLALRETERVLSPRGKIVVMEKLVDDGYHPSYMRQFLNFFTQFIFADINRNLTQMMGENSLLKVIYYRSLENELSGFFMNKISAAYRVATLVRDSDYPEASSFGARLSKEKDD
ncbi:MAG TPA: methyltransferase domain-containing protein [Alphaproteobacteria bacterium]|nr:MAG: hypothetical protein B7X84_05835 [Alphaproteobacteria bacterium 17-39-52]HQS84485.1 methyltransferase domain-containing protein [Alphaproteobacteria bacterium]HQS93670.1 methyltransferase domain-containing protein [Alphaproteobacteria bacterium]